jgi:hypothetical protein
MIYVHGKLHVRDFNSSPVTTNQPKAKEHLVRSSCYTFCTAQKNYLNKNKIFYKLHDDASLQQRKLGVTSFSATLQFRASATLLLLIVEHKNICGWGVVSHNITSVVNKFCENRLTV